MLESANDGTKHPDASPPRDSAARTSEYLEFHMYNFNFNRPDAVDALAAYVDDEDRPLRENKATPEVQAASTYDLKVCPFPGSRKNHPLPMNVSAMRQIGVHWKDLLAIVDDVRTRHLAHVGRREVDTMDMACIANVLAQAPFFLLHRRGGLPGGAARLPALIAAAFKALIDLGAVGVGLMRRDLGPGPTTVDEAYEFADREGFLIGRVGVCAGPEKMIRELVAAVLHGAPPGPPSRLTSLVGDPDSMVAYGHEVFSLQLLQQGTWHHLRYHGLHMIAALESLASTDAEAAELLPGCKDAVRARPTWMTEAFDESIDNCMMFCAGITLGLLPRVAGERAASLAAALLLPHADDEPTLARLRRLTEQREQGERGGRARVVAALAPHIAGYLALERRAELEYPKIQRRLRELRGFVEPVGPLTRSGLRDMFGHGVPRWLESSLGVQESGDAP